MSIASAVWAIVTVATFSVRVGLTCSVLGSCTLSGFVLGGLSVVACVTTVLAWSRGNGDLSGRGCLVGLLHLVPVIIQPGASALWAVVAFWVLIVLQCWAKFHLASRTTVTGPVWVSMIDTGPYRYVRHPMTGTEAVICAVACLGNPTSWNLVILVPLLFSKVLLTWAEDLFLREQPSYTAYCERVRYWFVPGVF